MESPEDPPIPPWTDSARDDLKTIFDVLAGLGFKEVPEVPPVTGEWDGPTMKNAGNSVGYTEPGEGEEPTGAPGYADAAFIGIGRDMDFPAFATTDDCTHVCGLSDDKGFMTVVHHVPKTTCDSKSLTLKKACATTGMDEESGRKRTDYHSENEWTFDPGPLLDVEPLTTNGEKGT